MVECPLEKWIVCAGCGMSVGKYSVYYKNKHVLQRLAGDTHKFGNRCSKICMKSCCWICVCSC